MTETTSARPEPPAATTTVAVALLAGSLFLFAWAALHFAFYAEEQIIDTPVYESYGRAIADGRVPYRDFEVEYPPLALPVFALPALDADDYRRNFEWLMAFCGCVAVVFVALAGRALRLTAASVVFVGLAPLAIGSVILSRFDLWPAAIVAGALTALLTDRLRLGHVALGAAIAAKLFAVVLFPLTVAYVWRRRGRREAVVCATFVGGVVLAAYLPFLAIAPEGTLQSIGTQLSRPLQIESAGAAILLAAHQLFGLHIEMHSSHGSQNLRGTAAGVLAVLQSLAQVSVLVLLWVRFARGPATRERLGAYAAAALVAFVALGKVLSPQFLIWLAPVVPLARRWLANGLLALALVLTQLWFPFRYWDLVREFDALASWLVLLRDVTLIALLVVLVRGADATASRRGRSRTA